MAEYIKQGDAYPLPLTVSLNGERVEPADIETLEVMVGGVRKTYPGEITYSAGADCFRVPLTQEDTFSLPAGEAAAVDVRVKFAGGSVIGPRKPAYLTVFDAVSEEVI